MRQVLTGSNGRTKIEGWLPKWFAFPPSGYTTRGGIGCVERSERIEQLAIVETTDNGALLRSRIEMSRSLRELWHLRADVFEIVAENRGEGEAKARVAALNHHFPEGPARSPRESNRSGKVTTW